MISLSVPAASSRRGCTRFGCFLSNSSMQTQLKVVNIELNRVNASSKKSPPTCSQSPLGHVRRRTLLPILEVVSSQICLAQPWTRVLSSRNTQAILINENQPLDTLQRLIFATFCSLSVTWCKDQTGVAAHSRDFSAP